MQTRVGGDVWEIHDPGGAPMRENTGPVSSATVPLDWNPAKGGSYTLLSAASETSRTRQMAMLVP